MKVSSWLRIVLVCLWLAVGWPVQAQVTEVAPGVYFQLAKGGCNTGWVIFDDYVFVIDANFPDFAAETIPLIRQTTDKPIRFVFDTHHHGDHAFGNGVYAEAGAVPIAQQNCFNILLGSKELYQQLAPSKPPH